MADDADIIPGPYILQYGYHFGVVIIKLIFGPSFFFCPCGFRQTNVAACGQCGTLSGYYFFLNGRGCFADLYSSLIQGDGGGIAGIGIYVEYGAQHLCLHFIGRDDGRAVGVFGYFEACFSGEVYGAASLRETLWGIPDGCLHLKGRDFRPPM